MGRKFNFIIILLLSCSVSVFCEMKNIFILKNYDFKEANNNQILFFDYCCDYITTNISFLDNSVEFSRLSKNYNLKNNEELDKAKREIFNNGGNSYIYYNWYYDVSNDLCFKVELYEISQQESFFEYLYKITDLDKQAILLDASIFFEECISQIRDSIDILDIKPIIKKTKSTVLKKKLEHNYPYFTLSLLTTSLKLYFDQRTSSKIFSFFPVDISASFYPLKYMELGLFFRLDYDDMIFKYYDVSHGTNDYYTSTFKFAYGLFIGGSFFFDKFHYSLGLKMYNFHLYISDLTWKKTGDYRSDFFPQFAFYQKLDVKIFKFLSYSVQVSVKTTQQFVLENNVFYSEPFKYDFITLEVSLLGFSITF